MSQETVDFLICEEPHGRKSCPTCGIEYYESRAFCPECGADIASVTAIRIEAGEYHAEETAEIKNPPKKETTKLAFVIKIAWIAVLSLFAFFVAAVLFVV